MRTVVSRLLASVVMVLCAPLGVAAVLSAVMFGLRQFVSGWIPSRWLSDNPADWVFGLGVEGDAGNYLGFMVSALVAAGCWSTVQWAVAQFRAS
ncbi:MAG: hypothetical protein ACKOD2_14630 [Ilumatobacteraceae bacterium]